MPIKSRGPKWWGNGARSGQRRQARAPGEVVPHSRKSAGLGKGSMAGWRGAKGHPSAFSLPWPSSKNLILDTLILLYQGLERSLMQAGHKGGSYLPTAFTQVRKVRRNWGKKTLNWNSRGWGRSAISGVSSARENRGTFYRSMDGGGPK